MKTIYLSFILLCIMIISCGKGGKTDQNSFIDTTSIDTAGVEQLEKELIDLESKSSELNQELDSINNLLDE